MATTAGNLIDQAAKVLQDETNIRWQRPELLDWLNAGQREVTMYKPDASSVVGTISLVAGSLQTIPTGGLKVLDVTRNMGPGGTTPGRAIRLTKREILDAGNPNWHSSAQKSEILHFMTDPRTPTRFYVYPPASPTSVEAVYSITPTPCTGEQSQLSINEIYANTLLNYILFRAYSKDADFAENDPKSKAYYQLFATQVGISATADKATEPKSPSNPNA